MKKLISLILTLVLVLSMSITAFATETTDNNTHEVKGNYIAVAEGDTVYSVDVTWGSMEFAYEVPAGEWDEQTHSYISGGNASWTYAAGANGVKVTNRSNAAVNITVTTNISSSGITASVSGGSFTLGSAAENATTETAGTPTEGTAYITLSGELTDKAASKSVIGTVTVTITDEAAVALTEEAVNDAIEALKNGETITLSNVSAENHAAIVAALDAVSEGALISSSMQGLSATYTLTTTFADALNAWSDGTTLTMLGDVSEYANDIEIVDKSVTLDLNDKTLAMLSTANKRIKVGESGGESSYLTIRDSGTGGAISAYHCSIQILGGTVTLESGTLNNFVTSSGTFNMTGGTVIGKSINGNSQAISNDYSGIVNISGGTLSGRYGIWNNGTVHISGNPTITGYDTGSALANIGVIMTISGNPTLTGGSKGELYMDNPITLNTQPADGETWSVYMYEDDITVNNGVFAYPAAGVVLDASRFTSKVEGYEVTKNDDGSLALTRE